MVYCLFMWLKIITKNLFWVILIFIITFSVYLLTLSPTIGLEDSAEFITAAATLGIAHPSGYPLYILLGHIFSVLPFGELAWRINLMSAFFASLTAVVLYLVIIIFFSVVGSRKNFITQQLIALFATLLFAFSRDFWSQAVVAEVYTLHTFLLALLIYIFVSWWQTKKAKLLLLFSFLAGLSLTNHLSAALTLPGFLLIIIIGNAFRKNTTIKAQSGKQIILPFLKVIGLSFKKNLKLYYGCLFLFLVGLAVYLYLPLRSLQNPLLDWGNPENWPNFKAHILRAQYDDFGLFSAGSKFLLGQSFFGNLADNFTLPVVLLGFIGFGWLLFQKKWFIALATLNIFLSQSLLIILLRGVAWGETIAQIYQVYYLSAYFVLALWFCFGLLYLMQRAEIFLLNKRVVNLVIPSLIVILVSNFFVNYRLNDYHNFHLNEVWARNVLASLPQDAILLVKNNDFSHDTRVFSLMYLQYVEQVRPDVLAIDDGLVFRATDKRMPDEYYQASADKQQETFLNLFWQVASASGRPLFTTFQPAESLNKELTSRSNGWVYQVFSSAETIASLKPQAFDLPNAHDSNVVNNYAGRGFLADYFYARAAAALENGLIKESQQQLLQTIEFDVEPFSSEYQAFITHRGNLLKK